MSRGATYGYDQRCEFFGDKGLAQVGNILKTSSVVMDGSGIHSDVLQHSFPQRFHQGFDGEVAAFVAVALDGVKWPVDAQDCIAAQNIAKAASISAKLGKPIKLGTLSVRPIGSGEFGCYITKIVGAESSVAFESAYTRTAAKSGTIDWDADVIGMDAPSSVYVCSPDALHKVHALECLNAGKHVLVEKPVHPCFGDLIEAAGDNLVLMVGFHRRFHADFIKCRHRCLQPDVTKVTIRSLDPVPADSDMLFVLRNSVCHDVDMLGYLFPGDDAALTFSSAAISPDTSAINLSGVIACGERIVQFDIVYAKCHPSYVQEVIVETSTGETLTYGEDFKSAQWRSTCCEMYELAYRTQWATFASLVLNGEENCERERRMKSYDTTFARLEDAAKVARLIK